MEKTEFSGAKLALFIGDRLLVIRRDDKPDIPWPGHLDLPGGGREGDETPQGCVLRETREEVGLVIDPGLLTYRHVYRRPRGWVWFFAAHVGPEVARDIVFGDEGQGWTLMRPQDFADHPEAVPHFREQLRAYLSTL